MAILEHVPATYEDAVRTLARWQGEGEAFPVTVYAFPDPQGKVVQLVEVSEGFFAADEVWVMRFGPSEGFPFGSAVAMVTPEMWERVKAGKLALPEGWNAGEHEQVWPE